MDDRPRSLLPVAGLVCCGLLGLVSYELMAAHAGLVPRWRVWYLVMPWLVAGLAQLVGLWCLSAGAGRFGLVLALGFALVFRLQVLPVERVSDDDVHRYMWDGRVTASGENPYRFAPGEVEALLAGHASDRGPEEGAALERWADLAFSLEEAEDNLGKINYPTVRTVYPPLAQIAFALGHAQEPLSLVALKRVWLVCELASIALILVCLARLDLPLWWSVAYAWSPLAIKEFGLTGHLDVLVVPFILGCCERLLAGRRTMAGVLLGLAVASKIWPAALMLPLIRRLGWRGVMSCLTISALAALPLLLAVGGGSGLAAFGRSWEANASVYALMAPKFGAIARPLVGGLWLGLLGWLAWRDAPHDQAGLPRLMFASSAGLLICAPVVNPWYLGPALALAAIDIHRTRWFRVWTITISLWYVSWIAGRSSEPALQCAEYLPVAVVFLYDWGRSCEA